MQIQSLQNQQLTQLAVNRYWPHQLLRDHEEQRKLWICSKRFVYVPCGRQSGKTELAMRRLVRYLPIRKPWSNPKYVYAAPTYGQAKRIAWYELLRLIPKRWIEDTFKGELRIETIFGSTLSLIGLDKPQRAEGDVGGIDGIVIDENSDIKPGTFSLSIFPTLVHRKGWCWFIGVPKRFGIGAKEYKKNFLKAQADELPDTAAFTWPSSGIVSSEEVELARSILDPYDFAEQFDAKWLTAAGGIFHSFDREYHVRPCQYRPNDVILVGSDFNVDPMCWIFCHLRGDILEVFDEFHIRNTNTPETLAKMFERYGNHKGGWQMYGDASARGRHTSAYLSDFNHIANNLQLQTMGRGMFYLSSNPPMADRFASTNARICSGDGAMRIFIDPRCIYLILDLENRTFKPGTREPADIGDQGHMTDSLGYICYYKWPLKLQRPFDNDTIIISKGI